MPKRASIEAVIKYKTNVSTHPPINEGQKPMPPRSIAGINKNIGNDGRTYQKVASICEATRVPSPVSRHNHMIAIIEISGSDATKAPNAGLRLATSDTMAAINPESAALARK